MMTDRGRGLRVGLFWTLVVLGTASLAAEPANTQEVRVEKSNSKEALPDGGHTRPCQVVAHRGFSAVAPENTLISARKALEGGADGVECDVQRTRDGVLVLMHDDDVKRTTNGAGKVVDLTLPQIKELDAGSWKDKAYAGERVPTLAEYLALLKDTGCAPVIEIKMHGISEAVVQAIRQAGMLQQCYVICFEAAVLKEVHQLEPKLRTAWLFGEKQEGTPAERADRLAQPARACGAEILAVDHNILSPELVHELKQRGLGLWCWTVNEPERAVALAAWGVDVIETDRLDVMRALLPRAGTGK